VLKFVFRLEAPIRYARVGRIRRFSVMKVKSPPRMTVAIGPGATIAASILVTVAGCAALPFLGGSFIPELKEGHFITGANPP
jgi:Cu/Ag efflux pump CusA